MKKTITLLMAASIALAANATENENTVLLDSMITVDLDGVPSEKEIYSYDEAGNQTCIINFVWSDDEWCRKTKTLILQSRRKMLMDVN